MVKIGSENVFPESLQRGKEIRVWGPYRCAGCGWAGDISISVNPQEVVRVNGVYYRRCAYGAFSIQMLTEVEFEFGIIDTCDFQVIDLRCDEQSVFGEGYENIKNDTNPAYP